MQHDDSRPVVRRARAWRTARAIGVVSALVLAAAPSATSDDGLPPGSNQIKGTVVSTGLGSAAPAKQYFRVPTARMWADAKTFQVGGGAPQTEVATYAISPPGSPHPYGYFVPITVRTLAFGIVPAEATLTMAQLRQKVPDVDPGTPDPDGPKVEDVPVPWIMSGPALDPGDHRLEGELDLRVAKLVLDGVPVPVGKNCRVKNPAQIHLKGVGNYVPVPGGTLTGTIDVPAFTGCGVNGEDLSPLMTSMVSGTGNAIEIRQSEIAVGRPEPRVVPEPFPLPER